MKVIEKRDAFMSDYEVLQFLTKLENQHNWDDESLAQHQVNRRKKIKTKRPYNLPALQNITRDTISYLKLNKNYVSQDDDDEETKKTNMSSPISKFNDETFSKFLMKLNEFELLKAEKLQIMNQLPRNMVHLYSIVEECDSRFNEDQISQIIATVEEFS